MFAYSSHLELKPRGDSPAMKAALEAAASQGRRTRAEVSKARARDYLSPAKRWSLDMLWGGMSEMEPDDALAQIAKCRRLPSYHHRTAMLNLRGAAIAFRWQRRAERDGTIRRAA